jgi:hypothetical protein
VKLDMVVHAYNLNTLEAEARRAKFKAGLKYHSMTLSQKKKSYEEKDATG